MDKKGKMDPALLMVLMLGVFMAWQMGFLPIGTQAGTGTGTGPGTPATITIDSGCSGISGATLSITIFDKYTTTTERTAEYARIFLDSVDKGQKAEGGTLSVAPEQAYRIYASENSSTYYTQKKSGVMPCKDLPIQFNVAASGAPSFTYWDLNDAANTAVALSDDQTKVIKYRWTAGSKTAFGNPYLDDAHRNVQCAVYNTTVITSVNILGETQVAMPNSVNTLAAAHVGYAASCFSMPVIENNEEYLGSIEVTTSGTGPTAHGLNMTVSDVDYDLNADDSSELIGVEDEDKNALGRADSVGNILLT